MILASPGELLKRTDSLIHWNQVRESQQTPVQQSTVFHLESLRRLAQQAKHVSYGNEWQGLRISPFVRELTQLLLFVLDHVLLSDIPTAYVVTELYSQGVISEVIKKGLSCQQQIRGKTANPKF